MVLKSQQHEVVEVLLQKVDLLLVCLDLSDVSIQINRVCREHHSQSHENFGDVKEHGIRIKVEADAV